MLQNLTWGIFFHALNLLTQQLWCDGEVKLHESKTKKKKLTTSNLIKVIAIISHFYKDTFLWNKNC